MSNSKVPLHRYQKPLLLLLVGSNKRGFSGSQLHLYGRRRLMPHFLSADLFNYGRGLSVPRDSTSLAPMGTDGHRGGGGCRGRRQRTPKRRKTLGWESVSSAPIHGT